MAKDPYNIVYYNMHQRCYGPNYHKHHPNYAEVTVCNEWHELAAFKRWMVTQDWEGKHLDKDLLIHGSREYGPKTCMFVTQEVNQVWREKKKRKESSLPMGVVLYKRTGRYMAQCNDRGANNHLGYFTTPEEAHEVYVRFKRRVIEDVANEQRDPRVKDALLLRAKLLS